MNHDVLPDPEREALVKRTAAPAHTATRRRLLGAAGGLAAAASGWLLPSWLVDEVAASDGHHRRHLRRHRGFLIKDVAFDVTNDLDEHLYGDTWYRFNQFWYATLFGVDAHAKKSFASKGRDNLVILPAYRYYIQANNPYLGAPEVTLAWGGVMGKEGWSGGTTVVREKPLDVDASVEMTVEGKRFTVKRTADDDDYKRFSVHIQKA